MINSKNLITKESFDDSIINILDNLVTHDITDLGAIGDGVTDNKTIFINLFKNIKDYDTILIPKGDYLIKLTDEDLVRIGNTNKSMYSALNVEGKNNIEFKGNGTIIFDSTGCTKNPSMMWFKDCNNITINGIHFIGDAEFGEEVTIWQKMNGINIENCEGFIFTSNTMENILATLVVTGDRNSPSISGQVGKDSIISNNIFKNYGQITTFGGGVSRFIFSNNICVNALQTGIKLSTNTQGESSINNSYDIIIQGNIFTWEEDYKFSKVGWDTGKTFSPCGIMVECHSNNISILNNTIDLSRITQTINNPIQTIACVSLYKGNKDVLLYNNNVLIKNNNLYNYKTTSCISISPHYKNLTIDGNICSGNIGVNTYENITNKMDLLQISNNTLINDKNNIGIMFGNLLYNTVILKGNVINCTANLTSSGYRGFVEINNSKCDELYIDSNNINKCDILTYQSSPLQISSINITNNKLQSMNLNVSNNTKILNINGNTYEANKTINTIRTQNNSNIVVNFGNNSGYTDGSILNIDNGELRLNENSIKSKSGNPYIVGNSFIVSGTIIGQGSPEGNINAMYGTKYLNFGAFTNGLYLKTSSNGNTGWVQIK